MIDLFSNSLGSLPLLNNDKTRSVCAENPTGQAGKGGMATQGAAAERAKHLGRGWKISPWYNVAPGETMQIADIEGPAIIQSMWFAGGFSREIILRIYWDGQSDPSVECPLTEFFAYSWHKSGGNTMDGPFFQLNSIPVTVNPNRGFNCFWPMPFRKHCRITVENLSRAVYRCFYQINYTITEVPENAAYFHAYFRRTRSVPYLQDHVIIDGISGKGQYVGTAMFVGLNGLGNWWGEGEIKFFIDDDEEFPTICGTGTEDYFGGAYDWEVDGKYRLYSTPYLGMHQLIQPDGLYQCQQRFSMYRWHIMDPVRFKKKLKITIQDLGWEVFGEKYLCRQDDISTVAYWYQTIPHASFGKFLSREELIFI